MTDRSAAYQAWLGRDSAQRLLSFESQELQQLLARYYGMHMLYIGISDKPECLSASHVSHCFRMALPWQRHTDEYQGVMTASDWPFADESLDVVVLHHGLDFTRRPHQMIREAARVLVPNGYLVQLGFHPWGLWGTTQKLMPLARSFPWCANPVSPERLVDWLTLLDFRIEHSTSLAHSWPLSGLAPAFCAHLDALIKGSRWLNGTSYSMIAQKTVAGVTPIRMKRWRLPEPELGWASSATHSVQKQDSWLPINKEQ